MATFCNPVTQTVKCDVCGDKIPLPLGTVKWVADVLSAFDDAHRGCGGDGDRTYFAD